MNRTMTFTLRNSLTGEKTTWQVIDAAFSSGYTGDCEVKWYNGRPWPVRQITPPPKVWCIKQRRATT